MRISLFAALTLSVTLLSLAPPQARAAGVFSPGDPDPVLPIPPPPAPERERPDRDRDGAPDDTVHDDGETAKPRDGADKERPQVPRLELRPIRLDEFEWLGVTYGPPADLDAPRAAWSTLAGLEPNRRLQF